MEDTTSAPGDMTRAYSYDEVEEVLPTREDNNQTFPESHWDSVARTPSMSSTEKASEKGIFCFADAVAYYASQGRPE